MRAETTISVTGTESHPLKVATFNINNINKRLDNLLAWLAKAEPDVVSLQELKAEQGAFPVNALRALGYEAVWQGERSWNGVAILARNHVLVLTCTSLPGNSEDHQARYIEGGWPRLLLSLALSIQWVPHPSLTFREGWVPRKPPASRQPFSTAFHKNNSNSCDEQPLLRMQDSASSPYARELNSQILTHRSAYRLQVRS